MSVQESEFAGTDDWRKRITKPRRIARYFLFVLTASLVQVIAKAMGRIITTLVCSLVWKPEVVRAVVHHHFC